MICQWARRAVPECYENRKGGGEGGGGGEGSNSQKLFDKQQQSNGHLIYNITLNYAGSKLSVTTIHCPIANLRFAYIKLSHIFITYDSLIIGPMYFKLLPFCFLFFLCAFLQKMNLLQRVEYPLTI